MVKINMSGFHKIVANSKTQKTQLYVLFFLKLYMLHKVFLYLIRHQQSVKFLKMLKIGQERVFPKLQLFIVSNQFFNNFAKFHTNLSF